jgi:glycerol-3-phosphate dehydrogenase subunit C
MIHNHFSVEQTIDYCIKCNICTTACPVAEVTDLFPGPKYEAPQAGRFRIPGQYSPDLSVDYCSGCRVCNMVCTSGVKIAEINARARAALVSDGKISPILRLRNNLLARSELLGKVASPVAPLANLILNLKPLRGILEASLHIHRHAPLPAFSSERFSTWFNKHKKPASSMRKVVYFHGCSTQYYEPRIGKAAVRVLEANGFEVIIPPQNCCGLPLLSNGEFNAARRYHKSNVKHLIKYVQSGIPIVGTSTSCTLTLKEEAPELLDMHDDNTTLVAVSTYDINEFLLKLFDENTLNLDFNALPLTLAYHIPCQYKGHRLGSPGIEVLELIPDLNVIQSDAKCCGIAGTYGYKEEKYDIAMKVGKPLFDFIYKIDSPIVVCDSETCRWQISHATSKPAIHPIELLALAYGYPPDGPLATLFK